MTIDTEMWANRVVDALRRKESAYPVYRDLGIELRNVYGDDDWEWVRGHDAVRLRVDEILREDSRRKQLRFASVAFGVHAFLMLGIGLMATFHVLG